MYTHYQQIGKSNNLKDGGRKQMKDLNVSQHLLRLSMPE
jgi:hypothetical protein